MSSKFGLRTALHKLLYSEKKLDKVSSNQSKLHVFSRNINNYRQPESITKAVSHKNA